MMNPVVTARVPAGIRARGADVLREIGSSTSELINAAFEYVIQERELPKPKAQTDSAKGNRVLTASQVKQLTDFMGKAKVAVPQEWNDTAFEDLLAEAMEERHADLR